MHKDFKDPDLPAGISERRKNQRREQCEWHEGRDKIITDSGVAIAKHSGQWTILMWGVGLMSGIIVLFGGLIWTTSTHTNELVVNMDKTFTGYMLAHMKESEEGFRRIKGNELKIEINEKTLGQHDKRIDRLERFELPHKENRE